MKNKFPRSYLSIALLIMVMTSCSFQNPKITNTEEDTPTSMLDSIPTPDSGKAVLYGKIDQSADRDNGYIIFLSKNLSKGEENIPATLAFSYSNDPRATQNDFGEFLFTNVEPGQYAIVFWNVGGIKVVHSETSSDLFKLIDVVDGDIIDLGTIAVPQ